MHGNAMNIFLFSTVSILLYIFAPNEKGTLFRHGEKYHQHHVNHLLTASLQWYHLKMTLQQGDSLEMGQTGQ